MANGKRKGGDAPEASDTCAKRLKDNTGAAKKVAACAAAGSSSQQKHTASSEAAGPSNLKPRPNNIRKLTPRRPFPTVPRSVSATGPRSTHHEGKNYICITRKTKLGAYLRRCKDLLLKDGYKTLHLSAMGAAIAHLALLVVSLPPILPYAAAEIRTELTTGSVDVHDEVTPEDEDEDIEYRTRTKSTLMAVIKIGDGDDEQLVSKSRSGKGKKVPRQRSKQGNGFGQQEGAAEDGEEEDLGVPEQIVVGEPEQDMDAD